MYLLYSYCISKHFCCYRGGVCLRSVTGLVGLVGVRDDQQCNYKYNHRNVFYTDVIRYFEIYKHNVYVHNTCIVSNYRFNVSTQ